MSPNTFEWCLRFCHVLPTKWELEEQVFPSFAIEIVKAKTETRDENISGWTVDANLVPASATTYESQSTPKVHIGIFAMDKGVAMVPKPDVAKLLSEAGIQAPVDVRIVVSLHAPAQAAKVVENALSSRISVVEQICGTSQTDEWRCGAALGLRICSEVAPLWYADRHFPRFEVELFDLSSGSSVAAPSGWKVGVRVLDGNGKEANDKLREETRHHHFGFAGSKATVSALRFAAVSSKCGGFFRICVDLVDPSTVASRGMVEGATTGKIQILSYRLYHSPKLTLEKLTPFDSLSKMPGIGALYAKRFGKIGVRRVVDLARLDVARMTPNQSRLLLDHLRRERGGLNVLKLTELVVKAGDVVRRYEAEEHQLAMGSLNSGVAMVGASQQHQQIQQQQQQQQQQQHRVMPFPFPTAGLAPPPLLHNVSTSHYSFAAGIPSSSVPMMSAPNPSASMPMGFVPFSTVQMFPHQQFVPTTTTDAATKAATAKQLENLPNKMSAASAPRMALPELSGQTEHHEGSESHANYKTISRRGRPLQDALGSSDDENSAKSPQKVSMSPIPASPKKPQNFTLGRRQNSESCLNESSVSAIPSVSAKDCPTFSFGFSGTTDQGPPGHISLLPDVPGGAAELFTAGGMEMDFSCYPASPLPEERQVKRIKSFSLPSDLALLMEN